VTENITAEIFQVASDEAKESYNADIIKELPSDTIDHMEDNTDAIVEWFVFLLASFSGLKGTTAFH
jgi:broad-specificity NMP kinase